MPHYTTFLSLRPPRRRPLMTGASCKNPAFYHHFSCLPPNLFSPTPSEPRSPPARPDELQGNLKRQSDVINPPLVLIVHYLKKILLMPGMTKWHFRVYVLVAMQKTDIFASQRVSGHIFDYSQKPYLDNF